MNQKFNSIVPKEETFLNPRKYIDVTKSTYLDLEATVWPDKHGETCVGQILIP